MTSQNKPERDQGVQIAARDGRRSSQRAGTAIFSDAVRAVDPDVAARIERTKDWRKGYIAPITDIVAAGTASAKDALRIAADGLDAVKRNLTFVRDGDELPLRDAVTSHGEPGFRTATIEGGGPGTTELEVPYRGRSLRGDDLLRQLETWERAGTIEPSGRAALELVLAHPEWLDLSDRHFVLLGAASEMGPLQPLCSWRANVIAVDLPRPALWEHIVGVARAGAGRLHFPTSSADAAESTTAAGVDLLTHTPEVRGWLDSFEQPFTVGNYVYADGATFVRLAGAVDVLIDDLLSRRRDLSIAYLATPTDVFGVPGDVAAEVIARRSRSLRKNALSAITRSRLYSPNYSRSVTDDNGRAWSISDGLIPIQGPNYALAKSLQRWRATVARQEGTVTSANVAPSARTKSVTSNRLLSAAYRGASSFGVEIFEPATSRVLTAALMVHDLRNPKAVANPDNELDHPYDLFVQGALHGGIWRLPYEARSILPLGLVIGAVKRPRR
ncbi:MAG: hypothetical protein M3238_02345 [Actinomycetota bacterium]|nr:hypothetical protein [Actinomycetota bacterium]